MRKRTTIYIRRDLVEEAKRRGINISRFIEKKLEEELYGRELTSSAGGEKQLLLQNHNWEKWSPGRDSNPRPADYESAALPAKLPGPSWKSRTPFIIVSR